MVIDELVEILRFDFDDKDLKAFDNGVKNATKTLATVGAAAVAAGAAIFAFVESAAGSTDEMGKQAERIGIAVEAYQELTHAAELGGSSQSSLASSLLGVAKAASEAARGAGGGIEAFGILGVSATDAAGNVRAADDILLEVSDSLAGLSSQAEKIELLSKLGISEDMLLTLDQGSEAIRRQMLEARQLGGVLSGEAAKASADFNDELLRVTKAAKGIADGLAVGLMPQITEMLKSMKLWLKANGDIIKQNTQRLLEGLTRAISAVYKVAVRAASIIDAIAKSLGGWKSLIMMAAGAWAILNANMLLVPVLAIAAATALFLLIEDVTTFAQGGDSAIGSLIDRFPALEAPIRAVISVMKMAANGWNLIFTEGDKALEGLGILIDRWLIQPLEKAIGFFGNIGSSISSFFGMDGVTPPALSTTTGASNNVSNAQSVTANITVNAGGASGTDAKNIAISVRDEITKVMGEQNATAIRNLRGVVAQ